MTEFDAAQIKQQAFAPSTSARTSGQGDDLTGTADMLDLAQKKPAKAKRAVKKKGATKQATKRGPVLEPTQTIDDAIAARVPSAELNALLKAWGKYNLYQATLKAKAETAALANSIEVRRRKIADELLKFADGYGISMAEARSILNEAIDAKRSGKLK